MITKEAIKNGFEKGVISIEDDYAGCLGACCRIGDNAFYFIDAEDAYLTKEEYWKSYTLNMTINMIFSKMLRQQKKMELTMLNWHTTRLF